MRVMTTQETQAPKTNRLLIASWQVSDSDNCYTAVERETYAWFQEFAHKVVEWADKQVSTTLDDGVVSVLSATLDYKYSLIFHRNSPRSIY